jgi:hypothetical protein
MVCSTLSYGHFEALAGGLTSATNGSGAFFILALPSGVPQAQMRVCPIFLAIRQRNALLLRSAVPLWP